MIENLPAVNATLNGVAALLLLAGWIAVRRRRIGLHKACMASAFLVSALFLACYLVYHAKMGSRRFPIEGVWKSVYLAVLIPHILLAAGMLPLIFLTFRRALAGDFERHRRVARWTLPIWLYVSITGVVVYVMLYQIRWT